MTERYSWGGSNSVGRICQLCAVALLPAGLISSARPALAQQHTLRLPTLVSYELSVKNSKHQTVFDIHGEPTNASIVNPVVLEGTMRFSPKLCKGMYRLRFVYTTNRGLRTPIPYMARVSRGQLDGDPKRCPFAGLPRRGMKSMHVEAVIGRERLLDFDVHRPKGSGSPFARLFAPKIRFYPTNPTGRVSVRISVRYPHLRSHIVKFMAHTAAR